VSRSVRSRKGRARPRLPDGPLIPVAGPERSSERRRLRATHGTPEMPRGYLPAFAWFLCANGRGAQLPPARVCSESRPAAARASSGPPGGSRPAQRANRPLAGCRKTLPAMVPNAAGGDAMRGDDREQDSSPATGRWEDRIPQDHPLRPMRVMVDRALEEVCRRLAEFYSRTGRPSIPAERLLRALLVQILFSVAQRAPADGGPRLQPAVPLARRPGDGRCGVGADDVHEEPGPVAGGRRGPGLLRRGAGAGAGTRSGAASAPPEPGGGGEPGRRHDRDGPSAAPARDPGPGPSLESLFKPDQTTSQGRSSGSC
jgi:hypothetical protein